MLKLFFVITLSSAVFLWYCREYHTTKFYEVLKTIPYSAFVLDKMNIYLTSSPSFISSKMSNGRVFTTEELKEYNGESGSKGIYLAILGNVYNVEKGQRHYGPGGPYHDFAGRDASRAFLTGDFNDTHSLDHVLDLNHGELLNVRNWARFYENNYDYKGKLAGRFYDEKGRKTKYYEELEKKFNEAEMSHKAGKDDEVLFPSCNVEWNAETGTKVWCSKKSGGIHRDWIGVPRKLYTVGSESYRCVCVDLEDIKNTESPRHARRGHLQRFDNCNPSHDVCHLKDN